MARTKSIDRDRILDAVEDVITQYGAQALTLDLVAEQASISKGGLTYTFATKEEMLVALLDRDASRCRSELEAASLKQADRPYGELLALIDGCRKGTLPTRPKVSNLLAGLMHAPAAIEPPRSFYRWMLSHFPSNALPDRQARIAFMAVQGLLLTQGAGLIELPPAMRRVLFGDLIRLVTRVSL